MSESPASLTREEFGRLVQDVLHRLYDSPYLRKHPLAEALAGAEHDTLQRVQQLRRTLLDAIHALSPSPDVPAQSPDWRAHRILELRYIEGLSPTEVMQQLALSRSYYFREQARMLEALTATLWDRWQQRRQPAPAADETREQLAYAETERLSAQATWETVDAVQVLAQLGPIIDSLARAQAVALQIALPERLLVAHADRVLLRQALSTAITYAIDVAGGGQVTISGVDEEQRSGVQIVSVPRAPDGRAASVERQGVGLDVCRRLLAAMAGALELGAGEGGRWEARIVWPAARARTLLVVDDNQDFADLFRRYLAGHGWQVVSAADGAQARQLIAQVDPAVIVLDIMMPREDGWELLVALRAAPATRETPIIICSVLSEPRLASALGASAFLSKPVSQAALLRALAPWAQAGASRAPAP